jgi:signal peptidase I
MKKALRIVIVFALLIWFVFQFILTSSEMEDHTMESTIKKGDRIWINKLAVGAYFLGMKLPGISDIEHNDIIYYAYPEDFDNPIYDKRRLVSRVVGLPGEYVRIDFADVYANKKLLPAPDGIQKAYRVMLKPEAKKQDFFKKLGIFQAKEIIDSLSIFEVPLDQKTVEELRNNENVDYVRMIRKMRGGANRIFPKTPFRSWSEDQFGPLKIPKAGDVIQLDYKNLGFYKNIIEEFEGNDFEQQKDKLYINGKLANSYTIQGNYYFVLHDNRDRFFDSREFGFVPESYVLGKVIGID